jgi:hypothetical protein
MVSRVMSKIVAWFECLKKIVTDEHKSKGVRLYYIV